MSRKLLVTLVAGLCVSAAFAQDRVSAVEKGSVLVFPKVEIRYDSAMNLIQDTFISLSNDFNQDVMAWVWFVSESCTRRGNDITLTQNEPCYWSLATGLPKGLAPFGNLGMPYPDPDGSGDLVLRGYIVVIAINPAHQQIRWNHLYGQATVVHYGLSEAWEYNAYAFQALQGSNGQAVGQAGQIMLDGVQYDSGFNQLLLDYFASGSTAFSGGGRLVSHDTDLTLMILTQDLRQDHEGPFTTKAQFSIWNENEVSFAGQEYCFTKWDERLLSSQGGEFLVGILQTNKGRARIDGVASPVVCGDDSYDYSLLGVAAKVLTFDGSDIGMAGSNLFGTGSESAYIYFDIPGPPEEKGLVTNGTATLRAGRR